MKKIFCFFSFILFFCGAFCQQLPLISHFYLNPLLYNPAYTGIQSYSQVFLFHRDQWNFAGGPVVNGIVADKDFKEGKVGLGLSLFNQVAGLSEVNRIKINYAYHLKLSESSNLHLGISPGINQTKVNFSKALVSDVNDPMLSSQVQAALTPDVDAGILFTLKDLRAGVAINQLQGDAFSKNKSVLQLSRQLLGSVDYTFKIGAESNIKLVPLLVVKSLQGSPYLLDGNLSMIWKDMFWVGGSYRNSNSIGANVAIQIKKFRVGYCFESNKIASYSGVTNEISLAYVFNTYKQTKPESDSPVKGDVKQREKEELDRLRADLSNKEDQLILHEREIYALIDSLYSKAGDDKNLTNQEKLDKIDRTQKEVNKIKQELKEYNNEKNVEIYKLRARIEYLQLRQND